MRRLFAIVALLAILLNAGPAQADTMPAGLRWHERPPFTVVVVSTLTDPTLSSILTIAADNWSASTTMDYVFGAVPKRGPYVTVYEGYYSAEWMAITSISNDRGWITGTSIYLNHTWMDNVGLNSKQYVICQELGHALGLWHTDEQASCMGPGGVDADVGTTPTATDFANLAALYGG
jgi:hypothetical protein